MKRDENQNVEYKASWQDKYLEWVCGYANAKGGTIYFGIEDGTKKPVGVKNANKLMEDIPNSIRNTMGIVADVVLLKKQGKDVIRVKVRPSSFPVSYRGAFHYRSGAVKMKLTGPALTQFLMEKSGQSWDAMPSHAGYRLSEFTFIALNNRYKLVKGTKLDRDDFVSFGLATDDGVLTNTGALFADESPVSHSRVFCTRWNGLDMTAGAMDAADDQEYSGGLMQLLKYAEDFVRLHSRRAWHKRPEDRVTFYEYPPRSIVEMVINGLVHRDYLEYGSEVHIDIFDDRIEITSPGGMPGGRKVQDYPNQRRIPSCRRNKCVADMFERLGLMERKGSGFKKLFEDYEKLSANPGKRLPVLESESGYFRVTLPNLLYGFTDEQLAATEDRSITPHDTSHDTPHDTPHDEVVITEKVQRVLSALKVGPLGMSDLRNALKLRDRTVVREDYLRPCFKGKLVELTLPKARKSHFQKYRLTERGRILSVTPPVTSPVTPPVGQKAITNQTKPITNGAEPITKGTEPITKEGFLPDDFDVRMAANRHDLRERAKVIWLRLARDPEVTVRALAAECGFGLASTQGALNALRECGLLEKTGGARNAKWRVAGRCAK